MGAVTADEAATEANLVRWFRHDRPAYRGIYCQQFESDLDRYAELIAELKPPFIAEIGRAGGATTLFLADRLYDHSPDGIVISVDIKDPVNVGPTRSPVRWLTGDSIAPGTVKTVEAIGGGRRGLVLLDGDHASEQVTAELDLYSSLADYLVVEDTIMRHLGDQDGPHRALDAWLPEHPEFTQDPDPTPTQHPGGWLRRSA